jgi:hypothetical protein
VPMKSKLPSLPKGANLWISSRLAPMKASDIPLKPQ